MQCYNATFGNNLDINLTVRDGIISLGKLNSEHVRHSLTMSQFEVESNFIRNHITKRIFNVLYKCFPYFVYYTFVYYTICDVCDGWWRGVAVTRCVESTKLLYAGPG